jgi:hypothetical protein
VDFISSLSPHYRDELAEYGECDDKKLSQCPGIKFCARVEMQTAECARHKWHYEKLFEAREVVCSFAVVDGN